ncbi:TIGR02996 domain-containing protein [Myxococcus sp. 1LA]
MTFTTASNPELEAAILAAPDNVDAYLVYGDWLQAQDDPRGELIALQHALRQARGAKLIPIKRKVAALQKKHQESFLGVGLTSMVNHYALVLSWHLGFIHFARVTSPADESDADFDVVETLTMLLRHPSGRFIRDLALGIPDRDGDADYAGLVKVLTKQAPETLKGLFIGDFVYPDESELSWVRLGNLEPLLKALPQLTELRLRGAEVRLGTLALPELQRFTIESAGLPRAAMQFITAASWPKLESLELWFGSEYQGGRVRVSDLQPLLEATRLPTLKHLGLCNAAFSDKLAPLMAKSKVLKQLETLDLSKGTLGDADAEVLAANASAFKHLKKLDVTRNQLTSKGIKLLSKLCRDVATGNQREAYDDGEGGRYVAVGE